MSGSTFLSKIRIPSISWFSICGVSWVEVVWGVLRILKFWGIFGEYLRVYVVG